MFFGYSKHPENPVFLPCRQSHPRKALPVASTAQHEPGKGIYTSAFHVAGREPCVQAAVRAPLPSRMGSGSQQRSLWGEESNNSLAGTDTFFREKPLIYVFGLVHLTVKDFEVINLKIEQDGQL